MDVKSRRCSVANCQRYPAFNLPGETTARFCGEHRGPGMIDVHNKRCRAVSCQKRPTFNYPGARPGGLLLRLCLYSFMPRGIMPCRRATER